MINGAVAIDTASMEVPSTDKVPVFCHGCRRCIARIDPGGLKPGREVEIACRCKTWNVLRGEQLRGITPAPRG